MLLSELQKDTPDISVAANAAGADTTTAADAGGGTFAVADAATSRGASVGGTSVAGGGSGVVKKQSNGEVVVGAGLTLRPSGALMRMRSLLAQHQHQQLFIEEVMRGHCDEAGQHFLDTSVIK